MIATSRSGGRRVPQANWDLWMIDPTLRQLAEESIPDNPLKLLGYAGNARALRLVFFNVQPLRQCGFYERALIDAYTGCKVSNYKWEVDDIRDLFEQADRETLRQLYPPPPGADEVTLFRGIAGSGAWRRKRGLSWTASLGVACHFACKLCLKGWNLRNPHVLETRVKRDEILAYVDKRNEDEYIVIPQTLRRLKLTEEEMVRRAEHYLQTRPSY